MHSHSALHMKKETVVRASAVISYMIEVQRGTFSPMPKQHALQHTSALLPCPPRHPSRSTASLWHRCMNPPALLSTVDRLLYGSTQ